MCLFFVSPPLVPALVGGNLLFRVVSGALLAARTIPNGGNIKTAPEVRTLFFLKGREREREKPLRSERNSGPGRTAADISWRAWDTL